jgi:hypothetical protein
MVGMYLRGVILSSAGGGGRRRTSARKDDSKPLCSGRDILCVHVVSYKSFYSKS